MYTLTFLIQYMFKQYFEEDILAYECKLGRGIRALPLRSQPIYAPLTYSHPMNFNAT